MANRSLAAGGSPEPPASYPTNVFKPILRCFWHAKIQNRAEERKGSGQDLLRPLRQRR